MRIPLATITLEQARAVGAFIATAIGVATALGAFGWVVLPKAILQARWRGALARATSAESGLAAISAGFEALNVRFDRLEAEQRETRATLVDATLHIISVYRHFRRGGTLATMPEPPASMREAVLAGVHAQDTGSPSVADVVAVAEPILDRKE